MSEGLRWESGAGDVPDADPRHDLLAALDVVRSGLEWVREATARAWSLSEDELRESVAALYAARGVFEAATLATVLVLDGRPEAVPGAPLDRAASTFLQQRMRLDPRQAAADVRAAHVLGAADGELPLVGAALAVGEISREHADACVKAVARLPRRLLTITVGDEETGETVTGMEAVDRWLVRHAREHQVRTVKQLVEQLVVMLDPNRKAPFDEDAFLRRSFRLTRDGTGMGQLRMTLTPADAAVLAAAVKVWSKPQRSEAVEDDAGQPVLLRDERTVPQRQYDAVVSAWRAGFLGEPIAGMPPVNLLVTTTLDQLAAAGLDVEKVRQDLADRAGDGTPAESACAGEGRPAGPAAGECERSGPGPEPPEALRRRTSRAGLGPGLASLSRYGPVGGPLLGYLTCNATINRVLLDGLGAPLDVGRTHRLVTARQRKALAVRDGGCGWPGCACPAEGVDVHHLHAWQHGGATDLVNLGSFCERHHQMLHLGIGEARVIDGRLHVRLPAWIDPQERWLRNTFHQSHEAALRLGQQLALALDDAGAVAEYDLTTPPDPGTWHRDAA